ncbi:hypothetical protein TELCIR_08728 [Teladorsagia circumcincta]|uniref:Ras family protein n=1 Tax=Teladorsagia circumcincta TaxID=45464 RepID=A0A2G9UGU3_TELCI|nr:hypothetical protein TELCIR_08728 [Teladorsagia circumcincta]
MARTDNTQMPYRSSAGTSSITKGMDDDNYDRHFRLLICGGKGWQKEYISEFDAVVVVFAADDFKSFEYAVEVLHSVQKCDFLPVVIIENKIDLIDEYDFSNKDFIENSVRQARIRLYRLLAKQLEAVKVGMSQIASVSKRVPHPD